MKIKAFSQIELSKWLYNTFSQIRIYHKIAQSPFQITMHCFLLNPGSEVGVMRASKAITCPLLSQDPR